MDKIIIRKIITIFNALSFVFLSILPNIPFIYRGEEQKLYKIFHPGKDFPELSDGNFLNQMGQLSDYLTNPALEGRYFASLALNSFYVEAAKALPSWSPGFTIAPYVLITSGGWMAVLDDLLNCTPPEHVEQLFQSIAAAGNTIKKSNKEFYFALIPGKPSIYAEKLGSFYKDFSSCFLYNQQHYNLASRHISDISFVNLYHPLNNAKKTKIYFDTDTHWNFLGMLTGLQALANLIQPGVATQPEILRYPDILEFSTDIRNNTLGLSEKEQSEYYFIDRDENKINTYIQEKSSSGWPILYYTSSENTKPMIHKKTVIIGDSFFYNMGNRMANYFSDVTFYHLSSYDDEKFKQDLKDADVIVVAIVERNFLSGGSLAINNPNMEEYWNDILSK